MFKPKDPVQVQDQDRSTLVFNGVPYSIHLSETMQGDTEFGAIGQARPAELMIRLDSTIPPIARRITLWHEIAHLIHIHAGVEHDEGICDRTAYALYQLLKDNRWLAEEIREY